jgi:hypothetical protein
MMAVCGCIDSNGAITARATKGIPPMTHSDSDPEFDFRHFLRDTLILLGCKKEIADLLNKSQDMKITFPDVEMVRHYNAELLEGLKDRLHHINKMKVTPKPTDPTL